MCYYWGKDRFCLSVHLGYRAHLLLRARDAHCILLYFRQKLIKDRWSKLRYSHSLGIASAWDYAVDGPLEEKSMIITHRH